MVPADPNLTSEVAVPLPPGTRVHDHVIEQWLRAVPDGYLYRVIHAQTGAVAALHEYLPAAWAFRDAEGVLAKPGRGREFQVGLRRFLLRARQLRELEHPSLPRLIEAWPSHGTACILTAPASTKTLSDVVIAAGGRLPLDQAWPWLCACCDLAEWLHQQGKIHGSWDPETIGVTDDNRLILPMPEVDGPAHPASPWMPLEQTALAPKGVQRGPWTDVFGISGLAAFMLTGQSPATARRQPTAPVINTTPRASRTSASVEPLPRAMMAAIRVSLLPNARQRPQDIAQLKAMMGLFATAPVLSEELKAAMTAPEPVLAGNRARWGTPAKAKTGSSGRPSGFGELPTEPMPLVPIGDSRPAPLQSSPEAAAGAGHTSGREAMQAYRELAAWNGEEPLPPEPALRRRLSAGAAAAGAALVAVAAIWVVVAERPSREPAAVTTEASASRDIDRMLKSSPPAAGQPSKPGGAAAPMPLPEATTPAVAAVNPAPMAPSSTVGPAVTSAPSPVTTTVAAAPVQVPPQTSVPAAAVTAPPAATAAAPDRSLPPGAAPAVVPSAPPGPATAAPAQTTTPAVPRPSSQPMTAAVAPRLADSPNPAAANDKPAGSVRAASKPANAVAQGAGAEPKPSATARGLSCSQILLEQSLGAQVSAAELRNCR